MLSSLSEIFVAICISVISRYHCSKRGRSRHATPHHITQVTFISKGGQVTPLSITSHISHYFQGRPKSCHYPSPTRFLFSLNDTHIVVILAIISHSHNLHSPLLYRSHKSLTKPHESTRGQQFTLSILNDQRTISLSTSSV